MLDLYKRECPRCSAHLEGQPLRCPSCHKILPGNLSRTRRVLEGALLAVLAGALAAGFLVPDLAHLLRPPAAVAPPLPAWQGPGAEPAARAWAGRLEPSLESVCRSTFTRYGDRKYVTMALSQQLATVTRAQGLRLTADALIPTAPEVDEAMSIVGEEKRFGRECLRWSYEALAACESFKDKLASREANDCLVPIVLRTLASAPFSLCAREAKQTRVRLACALAAEAGARAAEKR